MVCTLNDHQIIISFLVVVWSVTSAHVSRLHCSIENERRIQSVFFLLRLPDLELVRRSALFFSDELSQGWRYNCKRFFSSSSALDSDTGNWRWRRSTTTTRQRRFDKFPTDCFSLPTAFNDRMNDIRGVCARERGATCPSTTTTTTSAHVLPTI